MNFKNGKGEMVLIMKRGLLCIQILDCDQTTAIQTVTLDYPKSFGGGTRMSSAPKRLYTDRNREHNKKLYFMQTEKVKKTMLSCLTAISKSN